MKSIFILILFTIISLNVWAQDTLNFKTVDTSTYQAYLKKDWKTVIKIGNAALKKGIDYYFLRMRLGIAYYERQNYRKAIVHFEKVKEMSAEDVVAIEYLFYAYKFIGDDIQAMKTLDYSNTKFANKLLAEQKTFRNFYSFFSSRIYDNKNLEGANLPTYREELAKKQEPIYTEQFMPKSYFNFQMGADIRFSSTWRLGISYQYFNTTTDQYILDPFRVINEKSKAVQTQWNFNNEFRLSDKLKASLFFTYLSDRLDYINIETKNIPVEYEKINQERIKNTLFGIGFKRHETYFDINTSASILTTTDDPALQADLGIKIYPFGNRKLILRSNVSFLKSDSTDVKPIFSQELTYIPFDGIHLSVVGNWGEMQMWNTNNGYNVYNGIYGISSLYQAKLMVRIQKQLYFKVYYEYMENKSNIWSKSLLPEDEDQESVIINKFKFYTHSIIGGLIWEF